VADSRATDWRTLGLLAAMYGLLIGNFAVYQLAPLPLPLHVLASAAAIHLSFTIWHEAVHRIVSEQAWLNTAVGVLGVLPYMAPYFVERRFHLEHHQRLNRRDDPNVIYTDGPLWQLPLRYPRILRFARERMAVDPRSAGERWMDRISVATVVALLGAGLWQGVLLDLVWLWLVPLAISKLVMDWYINYLPHVGLPPHRFQGTRIVDVAWFTPLVLCHNYHAIHHLWPDLPWHGYRRVFREKLEYLRERGVPIERGFRGHVAHHALPERDSPAG
jgi:fatty acid desaturase